MYLITGIEPVNNKKFKIFINGQFAFMLYKSELLHYKIEEEKSLTEEEYHFLHDEIVLKRAKLKALKLLTDMGRSEDGLKQKLVLSGFPDDIITSTIAYVKSFGYIDDFQYAKSVIYSKKTTKSRKEIFVYLIQKGVSDTVIRDAMDEEFRETDEVTMAVKFLQKKRFSDDLPQKEKEKILSCLLRKGVSYSVIKEAIASLENE